MRDIDKLKLELAETQAKCEAYRNAFAKYMDTVERNGQLELHSEFGECHLITPGEWYAYWDARKLADGPSLCQPEVGA